MKYEIGYVGNTMMVLIETDDETIEVSIDSYYSDACEESIEDRHDVTVWHEGADAGDFYPYMHLGQPYGTPGHISTDVFDDAFELIGTIEGRNEGQRVLSLVKILEEAYGDTLAAA